MGYLIKSSLSALSSIDATFCPKNVELDQYNSTFIGGFGFNFISALSGVQSFKNLNFTNFYLTNKVLLDTVTTYDSIVIKPSKIFTTLNFCNTTLAGGSFLTFQPPASEFFANNNIRDQEEFYGRTAITKIEDDADNFEISIIDDFTCRVSYIENNYRYYLTVSEKEPVDNEREVLFVGENVLSLSAYALEYRLFKYLDTSYIQLYSEKRDIAPDSEPSARTVGTKYIIEPTGDGGKLTASAILSSSILNEFYASDRTIKLNQEVNLTPLSPYNTSFVTYNSAGTGIDNDKSDFSLPSNYLLYSSSNSGPQDFNLITLKNIANNQDGFTSSNNLLSTSDTAVFVQDLRNYTSIFSDIDSERNEVLSLNYVYNNYDITIKPGTTYFTTPSSLSPFTKININDTKFIDSGSFAFAEPYLSDRVYQLDTTIKSQNATYLCTWLSGAPGSRGIWVDRYYYPDLVTKEQALSANPIYNVTYDNVVEDLIFTNSSFKTSVTNKLYFDKKSDLAFEADKRYRYDRIQVSNFKEKTPTNFCSTVSLNNKVNNYFKTINDNGGFALGYIIQSNVGDFTVKSRTNELPGGFIIKKEGNNVTFTFNVFDSSDNINTPYEYSFSINGLEKNSILVSFNAVEGVCNLYWNSDKVYTFNINAFQMYNKIILFRDIFVESNEWDEEILKNNVTEKRFIENVYLSLSPLTQSEELAAVFGQLLGDPPFTVQDLNISIPCGMRNNTDTVKTLNSINTNLKSKSNSVDINIKNLNITNDSIKEGVKNTLLTNIMKALPKTTNINDVRFVDYK